MKEQLDKLGLSKLNEKALTIDLSQIKKLETEWKISLPDDYRDFLNIYGNAMLFSKDVSYTPIERSPWTRRNGTAGIMVFYGLGQDHYNLKIMLERYRNRIPISFLPIADAPGGNQICLGVHKDSFYGKVYFWDHEGTGKNKDDIYLVANSFKEFIESFELDK